MTVIRSGASARWMEVCQFISTYALLQTVVGVVFLPSFLTAPPFIVPLLFAAVTLAVFLSWYLGGVPTSAPPRQPLLLRRLAVFKYLRDYFPISLKKTSGLDTSYNYLLVYHPESLVSYGAYGNFLTEINDFRGLFPGVRPYVLTSTFHFWWPLVRRAVLWLGFCDAYSRNVEWLLAEGDKKEKEHAGVAAVCIVPVQEKVDGDQSFERAKITKALNKSGVVKTALRTGAHLVPCYAFGESKIFRGFVVKKRIWIVKRFLKILNSLFPLLKILFYALYWPYRRPIDVVVGAPIAVPKLALAASGDEPPARSVEQFTQQYVNALVELFETHKCLYGEKPTTHLGVK